MAAMRAVQVQYPAAQHHLPVGLPKTSLRISPFILIGGQKFKVCSFRNPHVNQWILHKSGCRGKISCSVEKNTISGVGLSPWTYGFKRYSESFRLKAKPTESRVDTEDDKDFGSQDEEAENAARKENWIKRGWAPWEEILTPEAEFALHSLQEKENEALQSPESLESFKKLTPRLHKQNKPKDGEEKTKAEHPKTLKEQEPRTNQWGEPEPNETIWNSPLIFTLMPPRDWPPRGWQVDPQELAFIREAHKLEAVRIDPRDLDTPKDASQDSFPHFELFMKQYNEWVAANKDRLERESLEADQDYYPGRRRTGENYREGMYELPFVYPGQIYGGFVTSVHLYQGAFVFIGCVHDGWVPIKGNDWYWIRHHIKVGMHVQVEVLAKRDPYRYRFPIELRFVNPNIDHLIFNRFDYPPIFVREGETDFEELARESGRPLSPRSRPTVKPEDEPLLKDHPYTIKVWQLHVSEQMLLDEEENGLSEKVDECAKGINQNIKKHDSDEEVEDGQWVQGYIEDVPIPKQILITDPKDLDMDAARAERKFINDLWDQAEAQGKTFQIPKLRRQKQMDELDEMHKRRSREQREALIRDKSCRLELGLPLEEPGRYVDDSFWGKNRYDPRQKRFRADYLGDVANSKDGVKKDKEPPSARVEGTYLYDEDLISSELPSSKVEDRGNNRVSKNRRMSKEEMGRTGRNDAFVKSDLAGTTGSGPLVNGTESFSMGDGQGMFDNKGNWNDNEGGEAVPDTDNQ